MLDSLWVYPILFATGLAAGLIDSIAGGGGLIALPMLLGVGVPPQLALGTNKFQSCFGTFTAAHHYIHKGIVNVKEAGMGILFTFIGAGLGTWTVQQVHPGVLNQIIPFLLLLILLYMFFTPEIGTIDRHPRLPMNAFFLIAGLTLGFYDGFFGPGVGSFWAFAFVIGLGFNLTKGTGYTKVMNFTSNIVSVTLFMIGGNVWFAAGFAMAAGQVVGARVGSGLVIKKGAKFIRPIYITIVGLTILKLFYDRFLAGV